MSNDELSSAHNYLVSKRFKSLIRDLDSFDYVPLCSEGLKNLFHYHGVNTRYLG